MKRVAVLSAFPVVLLWAAAASAQDPVKVDSGHYKVVLDNATVRVLRVDLPAGGKTPTHQHPDTLVIPLASSKTRFTTPDGKSQDVELASETATFMPAGPHSGANIGAGPTEAIVIEFKSAAPGKAALPATRPGMAMKSLTEGPRGAAYRATADASFNEPAGAKHDYDQVVIALGPAQISLAIDGKAPKTTWARGDVEFIGRGVAHETKNAGGKPVDFVIVVIK
jgi:quercetin dioxygenase-like cupin family protein